MYKILVSDKLGQAGLDVLAAAEDATHDLKTGLSKEELIAILPEYDGWIVRSGTSPDADMIAAATKLKAIGRAGIGVDNIDIKAATANGVIVMNTPGANSMATAEQTMALMLGASRHTGVAHHSLANGEWNRSQYVGRELYEKTLGVIGFGKIGRLVAQRAQAFGMDVIASDPFVSEDDAKNLNVTLVDLEDLLAQADYVTLHTAVTPETANMINADNIAKMKDGAILVNVARGKLVDEAALAAALDSGKLYAAGIDVFQTEPPAADNPLVGHARVVHTPHLGASSVEAQRNVGIQIAEQVLDAIREKDVRNAVNLPFRSGPNFAAAKPFLELAVKLGQLQYHISTDNVEGSGDINRLEIEVAGESLTPLIRPIAASILEGMLQLRVADDVNYINAPIIADNLGIKVAQKKGLCSAEYPTYIACKVYWDGGDHTIAGIVLAGKYPRIVQFNSYFVEGNPEGIILLMRNKDVPGVIGQIGTILSAYNVNIGEWRLGRVQPGGEALSFINLDSEPSSQAIDTIKHLPAVTKAKLVIL